MNEKPSVVALPRAPFAALVLLIVVTGVVGILLLNTRINENAFVLHELRQEQAVLDQREQELAAQVAAADSPAQLAAAARRLGLEDRRDDLAYLYLSDEPAGSRVDQEG